MKRWTTAALLLLALSGCATTPDARVAEPPPQAQDPYFRAAAERVAAAAPARRARNVILFVGDGMGITTVTAARIYAGQRQGLDGESYSLAMDTFPHVALSRTYGNDAQISDSAPTATALMSGVKTNEAIVGLTSGATPGRCEGSLQYVARSVFEIAEQAGLGTGVVSTARITHATPAAAYAHVAFREWESDAAAARSGGGACTDIARQLVEWPAGDGFEIALGGGRANFLPRAAGGVRGDGRDLLAAWRARGAGYVVAATAGELAAAQADARVLGLFAADHMTYESRRARGDNGEPSLAEMTAAAIRRLSREPQGYVLLVEGGRIDHAHHDGRAGEALSETLAYDDAIRMALSMTSREDTLIIATADHSHTLTMAGYARRGNPILGLSADARGVARARDGRPYTTLGYANGPGSPFPPAQANGDVQPVTRPDLSAVDTQSLDFRQQALAPLAGETHGGEDVAIYAWGPGDAAVAGTMEQNAVFHVMARALGFSWR
jgi:alkaline phosphatase